MRVMLIMAGLVAAAPALSQPQAPSPDMYAPPANGWGNPSGAPAAASGSYRAAPSGQPEGYGGQPGGAPGGYSGPQGNQQGGYAAPGAGRGRVPFRQRFESANVTHDGRLTLQQAQAAHMGGIAHNFADIDRDHKGYVTMQDLREWHQARRAAHAGAGGGPSAGAPPDGPPE